MKLHEEMIVERTDALLDSLGDEAVGLYLAIERKLGAIAAPGVTWRMESGDTGFFRAIKGKRLEFLKVQHERFQEYAVLVSARPNGSLLHASWLLVARARLLNDLQRAVRLDSEGTDRFQLGAELDVFDALGLSDFLALTKLAFKTAIRELTNADVDVDVDVEDDDAPELESPQAE